MKHNRKYIHEWIATTAGGQSFTFCASNQRDAWNKAREICPQQTIASICRKINAHKLYVKKHKKMLNDGIRRHVYESLYISADSDK
jgi:hypothetical protein